jgi:hypothetical protein
MLYLMLVQLVCGLVAPTVIRRCAHASYAAAHERARGLPSQDSRSMTMHFMHPKASYCYGKTLGGIYYPNWDCG